MEAAAKTWTGEWWKVGGGGTAWDSMAYDPELDLLYVGTGNGAPWTRVARSPGGGDNLYLSSILAIRPDTGELAWHYQTTPGDNWDYTAVQHMILADLEIGGKPRKVIMQAPKNGFFYVLDRATGELLSAEKYVATNWASKVDLATGRPVETAQSDYAEDPKLIFPGPQGAHSWHPMSFSPRTGLVYIPAQDIEFWYTPGKKFEHGEKQWNIALDISEIANQGDIQEAKSSGQLIAWDPRQQKAAWRVVHEGFWNGGLLSTAGGLVVQGTGNGFFTAYDATSGDKLWEVESQTGIVAGPITYQVDGTQYLAVAAGYGGGVIAGGSGVGAIINDYHNEGRVIAFKLGGRQAMPRSTPRDKAVPAPPPTDASAEQVARGRAIYDRYCWNCHGIDVASSLVVPDLRYLSGEKHEAFGDIVLRGIFQGKGMPSFAGLVSEAQLPDLHGYIISEAQELYADQLKPAE
jgi:glucose dehydrogenase